MLKLFKRRKTDTTSISRSSTKEHGTTESQDGRKVNAEADPLRRLETHERQLLLDQIDTPKKKDVTFFGLMRYASRTDRVLQLVGVICCIAAGAALPLMTVVFGSLTQSFSNAAAGQALSAFTRDVDHLTLYFVYIAIGVAGTTYIYTCCFIISGENMSRRIREEYLKAIMRQNIAYFDKLGAGEVTTRITSDTNLIQDGISEKVGLALSAAATFVSAFTIAFIKDWRLTLILSSILPAMFGSMGFISTYLQKFTKQTLEQYSTGGTLAEEVISSIRVTQSFGTQEKLAQLYDKNLEASEKAGYKKSLSLGAMLGSLFFIMYSAYGLVRTDQS